MKTAEVGPTETILGPDTMATCWAAATALVGGVVAAVVVGWVVGVVAVVGGRVVVVGGRVVDVVETTGVVEAVVEDEVVWRTVV